MRFLVLARWTKLVIVAAVQVAAIKKKRNNKSSAKALKTYEWMFGNAPHNASVGNPALRRVNDRGGFGPLTQLMLFYAFGKYVSWTGGRPGSSGCL